ncbi:MAG: DUF1990 family protein, partial [bacterium]|nr:DUF1990 family protein [bacterium]
ALNQYTQRTVPGVFDVAGAAGSGTTVTVNSSSTGVTRHGEYFFKGHGLSNSPNAVFSTLVVSDGTTTTNIGAFLAGTPEAFIYDDDGNLLSDGRWDCTYDAENRLVSMQTHTALSPSPLANADARRIEFKNDYLGRRVQKTVRGGWNGSTFTTVILDLKNLYDGWNLLFEFNAASSLAKVRAHIWGLDVSGTLQGAGGVGGLLYTYDFDNAIALLPMYDAMGNNHGMIKATDGSLAAVYEYDAFGNTLRESGTYAATNPWRFSTKYTDVETGLVYYGHRYYSPSLGRFINKDPTEEQGGLNLYAFGSNNAVNGWDYLGQSWFSKYIIKPIQKLLGKVDNTLAKNNINVAGGVGVSYSVPIGPASPSSPNNGVIYDATHGGSATGNSSQTPGVVVVNGGSSTPAPSGTSGGSTSTNFPTADAGGGAHYNGSDLQPVGSGYGDIYSRIYTASLTTSISAEVILNAVKSNINNFSTDQTPLSIASTPFTPLSGSSLRIQLGNLYQVTGMNGFVNTAVAVTGISENSFTFSTLKGHPEAGSITFTVMQSGENTVTFDIHSIAQSANAGYAIGYQNGILDLGYNAQTQVWMNFLNNVIKYSGGVGTIETSTHTTPPPAPTPPARPAGGTGHLQQVNEN